LAELPRRSSALWPRALIVLIVAVAGVAGGFLVGRLSLSGALPLKPSPSPSALQEAAAVTPGAARAPLARAARPTTAGIPAAIARDRETGFALMIPGTGLAQALVPPASVVAPQVAAAPVAAELPTPSPKPRAAVPAAPSETKKVAPPQPSPILPTKPQPATKIATEKVAEVPVRAPLVSGGVGPAPAALVVSSSGEAGADGRPNEYVRLRVEAIPGVLVKVDGKSLGVAPIPDLLIEPGPHSFVAEEPDGGVTEQLIDVQPETRSVEFF
jgi:hypothetical protein